MSVHESWVIEDAAGVPARLVSRIVVPIKVLLARISAIFTYMRNTRYVQPNGDQRPASTGRTPGSDAVQHQEKDSGIAVFQAGADESEGTLTEARRPVCRRKRTSPCQCCSPAARACR